MSAARVIEYTAQDVKSEYEPDGELDIASVTRLPTIFACENSWDGNHIPARVGTLTRVQKHGLDYSIEYVLDPDIPPIPNDILFRVAAHDLDINTSSPIPESSRNHWSIKDIDLFKVLLKHQSSLRIKPKVFSLPDVAIDSSLVAVMMPFDESFTGVFEALKGAIESLDMRCQRADDIWVNDHVVQDVVFLLAKASIVICDLSNRNANVFYETGIAHTLGKEVILIASSPHDIPFDVSAIRHIQYLRNTEGLSLLADNVTQRVRTLLNM
jgi:hypothetical protein